MLKFASAISRWYLSAVAINMERNMMARDSLAVKENSIRMCSRLEIESREGGRTQARKTAVQSTNGTTSDDVITIIPMR